MNSSAEIENLDRELRELLSSSNFDSKLKQAVEYSLFSGGKRIRPLLTFAICSDLGGNPSAVLGPAAALEIVHCASLIHDDLPGLDNDDMRRGQPSCHKKFGEATALLAGDLMIALAFRAVQRSTCSTQIILEMTELLSNSFLDLCSGQQRDLAPLAERGDLAELHQLKTGALFAAAVVFGAWGAGVDNSALESAKLLGREIGLAFQIADDYVDLFGTVAERGRIDSSDLRNNKPTFFNTADKSSGLTLLQNTESRIIEMLTKFGKKATQENCSFEATSKLVDDIFGRVTLSAL